MQEAVPVGKGSMIAVLGSQIKDINQFIEQTKISGVCEIANDNSDSQVILSGEKKAIDAISDILKKNKKKSIFLPVSAPFHCSLMKSAAEKMKDKILKTNFKKPNKEIISNVTARPVVDTEIIKKLLIDQISSKVRWRESLLYMVCLLYTSPSPRDKRQSRMPSSA